MPEWTLVLCSRTGEPVSELLVPATLRWEEAKPTQVSFPLPHDDGAAAKLYAGLENGLPQVRAYLDGDLKASTRFAPLDETSDEQQSQAAAVFKSPLAGLEQRFRDTEITFTAEDQGDIAWALIDDENTKAPTGLVQGTITPSVARDRTYEIRKQILEALTQLNEVDGGVYFDETPLDPRANDGALAAFNAGPRPGTDKSGTVRFEVGDGTLDNCVSVERQIGLPVNRVTTVGDGDPAPTGFAEDTDSQDTFGMWETVETLSGVTEQATLDARAAALLVPAPLQVVTFEPDPEAAPRPWAKWWLGDTVSFKADRDSLQIATTARVRAVEIELDDQMNEVAWRVEWGDQRPFARVFRERLRALTRT